MATLKHLIIYALLITVAIIAGLAIAAVLIGIARGTRRKPILRWLIVTVLFAVIGAWLALAEPGSGRAIPGVALIVAVLYAVIRGALELAKGRAVDGVKRGLERAFGRRRVCQFVAVIGWICTGYLILAGLAAEPQEQLQRAVIVRADSEALVAESAHAARAPIGAQVELYCSLDGQFVRSTAIVQACLQEQPRPVISFKSVSSPGPCESRNAFRVFIRAAEITALVGTLPASIVDVSVEGFGVISPSRWDIGSSVQATLHFADHEFSGRACVCNFTKLEHDQTRYGLQVLKEEASLRNGLQKIATDLQQRQLRPPTQ